jgi:hypothetical protein
VSGAEALRIRRHVPWPEVKEFVVAKTVNPLDVLFEERRALTLQVEVDERERAGCALARELLDFSPYRELVGVPDGASEEDRHEALVWAKSHRPDVPVGIPADIEVVTFSQLGQLICLRCYRANVALVAWRLAWTLSRLAAYTGRTRHGGFTIGLHGTGIYKDGEWRDSWNYPRLRITPRGASQPGAFLNWGVARNPGCRPKVARHRFVDLAVLGSAVLGGEIDDPQRALSLLEVMP